MRSQARTRSPPGRRCSSPRSPSSKKRNTGPWLISPERQRSSGGGKPLVARKARHLLVSCLRDQHLLFELDALMPAVTADIAFYADDHAGFEHAVVAGALPIVGIGNGRVFVAEPHSVEEH